MIPRFKRISIFRRMLERIYPPLRKRREERLDAEIRLLMKRPESPVVIEGQLVIPCRPSDLDKLRFHRHVFVLKWPRL